MNPNSHNTATAALPLPVGENNIRRREGYVHHPKSMSCNDVYAAQPTMTMSMMISTHSPTAAIRSSATNQHYHYHGRKPSLVGFDPFEQTQSQPATPLSSYRNKKRLSVNTSLFTVGGSMISPTTAATAKATATATSCPSYMNTANNNNKNQNQFQYERRPPPSSPQMMTIPTSMKAMAMNTNSSTTPTTPTTNQFQYERRRPPSTPQMMTIPTSMKAMNAAMNIRDSSPTITGGCNNNQRQPPTPPSASIAAIRRSSSPSAEKHSSDDNNDWLSIADADTTPTAATKSPSSRTSITSFKFLRKSSLVKSLSLGRAIGNTSPTSNNTATTTTDAATAATNATKATNATNATNADPESRTITTPRNSDATNESSKTSFKFLRKSLLVKSLSLGRAIGNSNIANAAATDATDPDNRRASMPSPSNENTDTPNTAATTTSYDDDDEDVDNNKKSSSSSISRNSVLLQDLMELKDKFGTLNIPSLKTKTTSTTSTSTSSCYKNPLSPTSFLTGNTDEVVRTSEYEPSPYQMDIPSLEEIVTIARLNEIIDQYRLIDQNLDLTQFIGLNLRTELQQSQSKSESRGIKIINEHHIPIVQSLLECGDREISIKGYISSEINDNVNDGNGGGIDDNTNTDTNNTNDGNNDSSIDHQPDNRLEAVIFHGQRYFTVVFRGTTDQQCKILGHGIGSKSKKRAVPIDPELENVEVYSGFKDCGYTKLERQCFTLIDKLTEEHPFCDVVFTGYSYGAAMATLAAFRYATARPMMRVGCVTLASPKVGFSHFRHVVNSLPNLKVMRLELGQDSKCQGPTVGGWHVGHTLVLSTAAENKKHSTTTANTNTNTNTATTNSNSNNASVLAYQFDTPKHKNFFKTTYPDLKKYISTLEEMSTLECPWVKDFVNTSGEGVVINNESRNVV